MARQRERGATMVLVVVGLFALIAIAGLAIDTAHVLLNKSRLQSAVDAAALAGAKALDQSLSTAQATTAANSLFTLNLAAYPELSNAVGAGLTMATAYSSTLNPFNAGTTPALFIRASVTGFQTSMSLVSVLGIASISVVGTAVAGPSPPLVKDCNIMPVFMCGTTSGPYFGYALNQVTGLNQVAGGASPIGPGNYGLLALGGNGASIVRVNLAGDYNTCASIGQTVATEPGVAAGPVSQGINTRFNVYQGPVSPAQYPPDVINTSAHQTNLSTDAKTGTITQAGKTVTTASQVTFNYGNYQALLISKSYDTQPKPAGTAEPGRRIMAAPVGDCTGAANGKNSVQVSGFLCLFLLQQLPNGSNDIIYGQVLDPGTGGCTSSGSVGAGATNGPHKIELYKSAGSPDS